MGPRWGFCLSVVWWSIANILTAFAGSVGGFSICRFLLGVGEAGNFPASIKTISEWFPARERALATGIFNMGAGFGAIIAPPLIGVLEHFNLLYSHNHMIQTIPSHHWLLPSQVPWQ